MTEIWFTVADAAVVVDSEMKPIGSLLAGKRYRATQISEDWVTVLSPDGSAGLVPTSAARLEAPPLPPTVQEAPPPIATSPAPAPTSTVTPASTSPSRQPGRKRAVQLLASIGLLAAVGLVSWILLSDTFGEPESGPVLSADSNVAEAVGVFDLQIVRSEPMDQLVPARPLYAFDRIWITSDLSDAIMVFDPITQNVLDFFEIGTNPAQAYEVLGKVWVSTSGRTISVIDPVTLSVESIDTGSPSVDFAASSGAVWVANFEANTVTAYDPDSLSVMATVQVGDGPAEVISVGDEVWVVNYLSNEISIIDAASFSVVDTIPTDEGTVATVANGEVWLLGLFGLSVVDPITRSVSNVAVPGIDFVFWMEAVGDELWFSSFEGAIVLDAPSRTTTEVRLGESMGTRPAADAETVWVATESGDLVGLDRETLSVVARVPVGAVDNVTGFIALGTPAVAADGIWIADANEDSVKVIGGRN